MAFTSIVIVIVVIYVFGYAGMIIFDLFFKKDPVEFMPKPKDVEIDISDEAGQFKLITVGNDEPKAQPVKSEMLKATRKADENEDNHSITEEEKKAVENASKPSNIKNDMKWNVEVSFEPSPTTPSETNIGSEVKGSPSERKPTDDIEPRPTDAETQKRIQELVRIKRQEILAEEMTIASAAQDEQIRIESETVGNIVGEDRSKDSENRQSEVSKDTADEAKPSDPDVRIVEPEQPHSPQVSNAEGEELSKGKNPSKSDFQEKTSAKPAPAKKPRPPKPLKQPEFRSDAYFDILKVQIDDSKQQTKLQGAQTAEQVSKEAKQVSLDEAQMTLRQINNLWEKKELERVPDEDERQAIEKSERSNREAPPEFNI